MGEALARLAKEDPSFRVSSDEESGQTIIKGMGELHLDIIVDRMKREFKVEANVGAPQVAYRETIEKSAEFEYIHKKQSGVLDSLQKLNYLFNHKNLAKVEMLKVQLREEQSLKNLFLELKKVLKQYLIVEYVDFHWLIIKLQLLMDYIMMLTQVC